MKDFKWEKFLRSQNRKGFWPLAVRLSLRLMNQRVVSVRHLYDKAVISNCVFVFINIYKVFTPT